MVVALSSSSPPKVCWKYIRSSRDVPQWDLENHGIIRDHPWSFVTLDDFCWSGVTWSKWQGDQGVRIELGVPSVSPCSRSLTSTDDWYGLLGISLGGPWSGSSKWTWSQQSSYYLLVVNVVILVVSSILKKGWWTQDITHCIASKLKY